MPRLLPRNPRNCKILQDRAKKFKKFQDSYQEFQEKPRIGKKMQEVSRFPFRTSFIIKPSEVSANELINYPKTLWNYDLKISGPKLIMEDPKNAPDVEKSLDYALTIANSDLN